MKSKDEVGALEKFIGLLQGLHAEISQLVKKSPNDGLNTFKLKMVNSVLAQGNDILKDTYRPIDEFEQFEHDDLPSNSDVAMVLTLYLEQAERFRSDNVIYHSGSWVYQVNDKPSDMKAKNPTRIGGEKK